jgi:hypothetical protein
MQRDDRFSHILTGSLTVDLDLPAEVKLILQPHWHFGQAHVSAFKHHPPHQVGSHQKRTFLPLPPSQVQHRVAFGINDVDQLLPQAQAFDLLHRQANFIQVRAHRQRRFTPSALDTAISTHALIDQRQRSARAITHHQHRLQLVAQLARMVQHHSTGLAPMMFETQPRPVVHGQRVLITLASDGVSGALNQRLDQFDQAHVRMAVKPPSGLRGSKRAASLGQGSQPGSHFVGVGQMLFHEHLIAPLQARLDLWQVYVTPIIMPCRRLV